MVSISVCQLHSPIWRSASRSTNFGPDPPDPLSDSRGFQNEQSGSGHDPSRLRSGTGGHRHLGQHRRAGWRLGLRRSRSGSPVGRDTGKEGDQMNQMWPVLRPVDQCRSRRPVDQSVRFTLDQTFRSGPSTRRPREFGLATVFSDVVKRPPAVPC